MSDNEEFLKNILSSLSEEQLRSLIEKVASGKLKQPEHDIKSKKPVVNENFTVTRNDNFNRGRTPVRAKKNEWEDVGEDRDPDFDPAKFEKMGRAKRGDRQKPDKRTVECHICGRTFSMYSKFISGEFLRCDRCTGGSGR